MLDCVEKSHLTSLAKEVNATIFFINIGLF